MIIDFHTHTFPDKICHAVREKLSDVSHTKPYSDLSIAGTIRDMEKSGVDYSVNLPVATAVKQVESINSSMIAQKEDFLQKHIITFGCMHPDYGDLKAIEKELKRLKEAGIPGIKMHPAYQGVDFDDPRFMDIMRVARDLDLIVTIHAGIDIGFLEHNFSGVSMILKVLEEVKPEKLVLAHMGGWMAWDLVEKELAGANLWYDTAFSLGPIEGKEGQEAERTHYYNMSSEQFVHLVRALGADRVLFASDLPWADPVRYISMIRESELTQEEQAAIFGNNARKLLGMEG